MSDNQESQQTETSSTSSPATTGKSVASKKLKAPKRVYGKMTVRLLLDHEHALRLTSVQLERKGEEIHTPQQLVDLAMDRFMEYLQVKKEVDLLGIIPKKTQPAK
jgi:hypothetical protein